MRDKNLFIGLFVIVITVLIVGIIGCGVTSSGGGGGSSDGGGGTPVYVVGDTGPAGGIIFYVTSNASLGWTYLEASPSSNEFTATWGATSNSVTGADGTAIGSGKQNTNDLVSFYPTGNYAANMSVSLNIGGKTDWFLPSKDELNEMYIQKAVIGGFSNTDYYTSTEHSADFSYFQSFVNGNQNFFSKDFVRRVRAIRAF